MGAQMVNPELVRASDIVRDDSGIWVFEFNTLLGECPSLVVELETPLWTGIGIA